MNEKIDFDEVSFWTDEANAIFVQSDVDHDSSLALNRISVNEAVELRDWLNKVIYLMRNEIVEI